MFNNYLAVKHARMRDSEDYDFVQDLPWENRILSPQMDDPAEVLCK